MTRRWTKMLSTALTGRITSNSPYSRAVWRTSGMVPNGSRSFRRRPASVRRRGGRDDPRPGPRSGDDHLPLRSRCGLVMCGDGAVCESALPRSREVSNDLCRLSLRNHTGRMRQEPHSVIGGLTFDQTARMCCLPSGRGNRTPPDSHAEAETAKSRNTFPCAQYFAGRDTGSWADGFAEVSLCEHEPADEVTCQFICRVLRSWRWGSL